MNAFKKALTNIRRTPYQSTAAVVVLTITFFVGILISFITVSLYQALNYFETRPQVLIFFENNAPLSQIQSLQTNLQNNSEIAEVVYIPQEEALDIYRDLNKNDPLLLELVTADILPASLEVSTTSIAALEEVAQQASNNPGVEEVVLRKDLVEVLNKWLTGIKWAGGVFVSLMAATSILIIVIVVGMKISGKNYEVKILRLIGASSWYIQGPFVAEGALYGLFSAILAYILSLSALLYSTPLILSFAGEVPLIPNDPLVMLAILGGSVFTGVCIGAFGSSIAVKRFLEL